MLIVLALAPLWVVGMFGRALWTPDEPREADIVWRMSLQSDRSLPQLAETPFLEKPPLTYWMSAAAISVLGDSPPAARLPNLLYALLAALAVGALALNMQLGVQAAAFAAVVAVSALTSLRVSVWLAPDAALMGGCALALLGAWRGFNAARGRGKVTGYCLMHLGAAIGFMAKSAPGWLVPALALLTVIVWERRWCELWCWELYAGLALQAALIAPWILAVAHGAHGSEALRALFWNNIVGRFTHIAAPPALNYTSGHHNWPGKYLFELPVYLLPWTAIAAAALVRATRAARSADVRASAWRFALAACVPFLVLLSVSATARDIYAAPALIGFGLLAGLWLECAQQGPNTFDAGALKVSRWLVVILAWGLALGLAILGAAGQGDKSTLWSAALLLVTAIHLLARQGAHAQRAGELANSLGWSYVGYAAAVCLTLLIASPIIDRWQNLPALARQIRADTAQQSLALLDPDETTIAMLDHGLATPFAILSSTDQGPGPAVSAWFSARGTNARVLLLLPGHAGGPVTRWLGRLHSVRPEGESLAARLVAQGSAVLARTYLLPEGRQYALLAPPG